MITKGAAVAAKTTTEYLISPVDMCRICLICTAPLNVLQCGTIQKIFFVIVLHSQIVLCYILLALISSILWGLFYSFRISPHPSSPEKIPDLSKALLQMAIRIPDVLCCDYLYSKVVKQLVVADACLKNTLLVEGLIWANKQNIT